MLLYAISSFSYSSITLGKKLFFLSTLIMGKRICLGYSTKTIEHKNNIQKDSAQSVGVPGRASVYNFLTETHAMSVGL